MAKRPSHETVSAELALLGRFAEPAIGFAISQTTDPSTRTHLQTILAKMRGAN